MMSPFGILGGKESWPLDSAQETVLKNLKKEFPEYKEGYEIAGFGWH